MNKELYVASTPHETRLALAEDGEVAEIYYEREKEYSLAGAIYKGRVTRVLPGMQSAFVDIGLERDAFLYVSDFYEDSEEYERVVSEAENAVARLDRPGDRPADSSSGRPPERPAEAAGAEGAAVEAATPASEPVAEVQPTGGAVDAAQAAQASRLQDRPQDRAQQDRGGFERGRRGRRGRHRHRGGRGGIPEAKFARPDGPQRPVPAEQSPAAPEPQTTQAHTHTTAHTPAPAYPAMVLPGESLAKYRNQSPLVAHTEPRSDTRQFHEATAQKTVADEVFAAAVEVESGNEDGAVAEASAERREFELDRGQPDSPWERPSVGAVAGDLTEAEFEADMEAAAEDDAVEEGGSEEDEFEEDAEGAADMEAEAAAAEEAGESENDGVEAAQGDALAAVEEGAQAGASAAHGQQPAPSRMQTRPDRRDGGRFGRGRRRRRGRGGESRGESSGPAPQASTGSQSASQGAPQGRLIGELLHAGQEILIQISKEPLGKKGARITSHLALPGRFLVYMPTVNHVGVSRKIASDEERARLKRLILENSQDLPGGFIVRTAGAGASDEEFKADIRLLSNLWADMKQQFERAKAPALLHHDLNLVERTLRDQLSDEFTHIWVDTDEQYQRVVKFVNYFMPHLASRVRLYTRDEPLFEHFGLEDEINKALKSKVWLKSGGYIVLNQTEALVAIDVNTGKYVGKSNRLEDTIVKTNVDAIKEIVRQIRLRDLGGIIVIDFIDMDERRNRQRVMQALDEALRADRSPTKVLSFNDFGLVALTRKRVKQSLERTLGCACPYCEGVGLIKSPVTVCNEIYTEVKKVAPTIERDDLVLRVNPEIARSLKAEGAVRLRDLEEVARKPISVRPDPLVHQEQFEIY